MPGAPNRPARSSKNPNQSQSEFLQMKTLDKPLPPGGTVGIVGGGQLGRMLALSAARLGLQACIYNDAADAPAFQVTPNAIVASYDDLDRLGRFADACDVVTFEFENLPAHAIAHLG